MGSPQRATVVTSEAPKSRANAWDQVSRRELAFDFTQPEVARSPRTRRRKGKAGVREAIIRWLEEQL
jgi:hypothetical protein